MKNLFSCLVAFCSFLILFSTSIFVLSLLSIELDKPADLIGLFGANATLFGALVIIYGFTQWKDQANSQLRRDLALKTSESLNSQYSSIFQIYCIFKTSPVGMHQFSPSKSNKLSAETIKIFEEEWQIHVDSAFALQRSYKRLERINKDSVLKEYLVKFSSTSGQLTDKLEFIFNFKYESSMEPTTIGLDFTEYSRHYTEIDALFTSYKELTTSIDTHLDKYILIKN